MHKIHVGVYKFLHSCAERNQQDMNFKPCLKKRLKTTPRPVRTSHQPSIQNNSTPKKNNNKKKKNEQGILTRINKKTRNIILRNKNEKDK